VDSIKSEFVRLISRHLRTTLNFKLEDAHNWLHDRSDHHSLLKVGSHDNIRYEGFFLLKEVRLSTKKI
jgi:hypothetical protein